MPTPLPRASYRSMTRADLRKLQETLGLGLKRNCLDLCRCATVTCWGLLWI
tara:strand:+ start:26 stop:178 length:153 start_codon:yes stop_codon:yes gene_type:complete